MPRLATLERSMSAANRVRPEAAKSSSSAAQVPATTSPATPDEHAASSSAESDLADRVAALEAHLSRDTPAEAASSLKPVKSLGLRSDLSTAGANSTQRLQSDSGLREQLSQLQQQIEAVSGGKANKADLDALQLRVAVLGSSSGGTGCSNGLANGSSGSGGSSGNKNDGGITGGSAAGASRGATDTGTHFKPAHCWCFCHFSFDLSHMQSHEHVVSPNWL